MACPEVVQLKDFFFRCQRCDCSIASVLSCGSGEHLLQEMVRSRLEDQCNVPCVCAFFFFLFSFVQRRKSWQCIESGQDLHSANLASPSFFLLSTIHAICRRRTDISVPTQVLEQFALDTKKTKSQVLLCFEKVLCVRTFLSLHKLVATRLRRAWVLFVPEVCAGRKPISLLLCGILLGCASLLVSFSCYFFFERDDSLEIRHFSLSVFWSTLVYFQLDRPLAWHAISYEPCVTEPVLLQVLFVLGSPRSLCSLNDSNS